MSSAHSSVHSVVEPETVEALNSVDDDLLLIERSKVRSAVSKLTKAELQNELKSHNRKVSGNKDLLIERVTERRLAALSLVSQEHKPDASPSKENPGLDRTGSSELLMLFNMMQSQQAAAKKRFHAQLNEQQAAAEKRFHAQLNEKQVAAERRFQIQLEEIRQRSLEDRMQLTKFLADTQLHVGHSSLTDGGFSPKKLTQKFNRLDKESRDLMIDLQQRFDNVRPVHEVEVILTAMQGSMDDCKAFVDSKIDSLEDEGTKDAILSHYELTKKVYYNKAAAAKAYISKINLAIEEDKQAGCLPNGITPPVF